MSRTEVRAAAVRFSVTTVLVLALVFCWVAVLSFNIADPPGDSVYPQSASPRNLCGTVGAHLTYYSFYYLGVGTYALLALLTAGALTYCRQGKLPEAWSRGIGLLLVVASASTAGAVFLPVSDAHLMTGPGGVLGLATRTVLLPRLDLTGTTLLMVLVGVVGLVLAADELVMRGVRSLGRATPVFASAGAAVMSAVTTVGGIFTDWGGDSVKADKQATASKAKRGKQLALDLQRRSAKDEAEDEEDEELEDEWEEEDDAEAEEEDAEDDGEGDEDEEWEEVGDEEEEDDDYEYEYEDEDEDEDGEEEEEDEEDASLADAPAAVEASRFANLKTHLLGARREPEPATYHRPPDDSGYEVPPLDLLEDATPIDRGEIEQLCREKAMILERTLNEFKHEVRVVAIETGPVITVFELDLAPGVKVSQIASLSNDMARALGAPSVRVVAPLPGTNTIGIEVPNIDKEKVRVKEVMAGVGAKLSKMEIPLFLGKDAAGQPLVTDLTKMPHLLIAGTTGSGKSVCISSIVMSALMTRTPSELQMILVDPKVVELTMFKDVPHLMCPIVSDMSKAESILEWASVKMDERYALLAEAGVKDIKGYNKLGEEGLRERFQPTTDDEWQRIPTKLPYIVIIIDELADLMMTSAKEVEFYLCRIAQKSRAVGIHLIVSTQRPSANVVTGLIKSNLPSRIAFRVASRLDSRIVLDQNGGEVLMGQGDMLFLPPGQSKLVRAQGTFIDDSELRAVVEHCRTQCDQRFHPELMRAPNAGSGEGSGERDELFDQAVDIVVASGRGSVSLLQRRLTIGYGRASRLIEQMYEAGLVGEYKGSQAREVNITKDEWAQIRNQRDAEEAQELADVE